MQKYVNLVDLEKCWKMSIWLEKMALIQPRTSPLKFDHLSETKKSRSWIRYRICQLRSAPVVAEYRDFLTFRLDNAASLRTADGRFQVRAAPHESTALVELSSLKPLKEFC